MARNMPKRRTSRQGARPVYHEAEPGGVARRTRSDEDVAVRERTDGLGLFAWALIVLVALILVDAYVWNGQYRHGFWVAINAQSESTRAWSDGLWK